MFLRIAEPLQGVETASIGRCLAEPLNRRKFHPNRVNFGPEAQEALGWVVFQLGGGSAFFYRVVK